MGLFDRTSTALAAARTYAVASEDPRGLFFPVSPALFTTTVDDVPGLIGGAFGVETASMVPAFRRGLSLITGVAAGLPLVTLDPDTGRPMSPMGLLARPTMEPGTPNTTLIRRTVSDMVCYGRAFWGIADRDGNRWPTSVRYVPADRVTPGPDSWLFDGEPTRDLIDFVTGEPGALDVGWLALRTAISLETAANTYATSPVPALALKSTGIDLDDDDALALVNAWEAARRKRATAYLNSQVAVEQFGWNAAELQLVEARQHAAIEVARVLNLDPVWVGASPSGSSLTYQNRQDMNQALLDATILPLLRVIEQRLTLPDVSGERRQIRFDTSAFLRANFSERVAGITAYVAAGILTVDEARAIEPMVPLGRIPE